MSDEPCVRCHGGGAGNYRVITRQETGESITIHETCLVSFLLDLAGGTQVLFDRYRSTPPTPEAP